MSYLTDPEEFILVNDVTTGETLAMEGKYYHQFISVYPHLLFPVFKVTDNQMPDKKIKLFKPKRELRLPEDRLSLRN